MAMLKALCSREIGNCARYLELKKDFIKAQLRKLILSEPTHEEMQDLLVELMCSLLNDGIYGFKAASLLEKHLCCYDDPCFLNVISVADSLSRQLSRESMVENNIVSAIAHILEEIKSNL